VLLAPNSSGQIFEAKVVIAPTIVVAHNACSAGWLICSMDAHEGAGTWLAAAATFAAVVVSLWSSGEASRIARMQVRAFVSRCDEAVLQLDWLIRPALDQATSDAPVLQMSFGRSDQFSDANALLDSPAENWPTMTLMRSMREYVAAAAILGSTSAVNTSMLGVTNAQASVTYRTTFKEYWRASDSAAARSMLVRMWNANRRPS